MNAMNTETLKKTFLGEIATDAETLDLYSHDASLFEVRPLMVAFPRNSADVQNLVKWVNTENAKLRVGEKKLSITARSAGTCMSGGAINDSIIIDFTKHMNQIIEVSDDHAITQPGVFYRDLEKETLKRAGQGD